MSLIWLLHHGLGRRKSDAGWIFLDFAQKIYPAVNILAHIQVHRGFIFSLVGFFFMPDP